MQGFDDVASGVLVAVLEFSLVFEMLFVVLGIRQSVQRAADHRLRFGFFGGSLPEGPDGSGPDGLSGPGGGGSPPETPPGVPRTAAACSLVNTAS